MTEPGGTALAQCLCATCSSVSLLTGHLVVSTILILIMLVLIIIDMVYIHARLKKRKLEISALRKKLEEKYGD